MTPAPLPQRLAELQRAEMVRLVGRAMGGRLLIAPVAAVAAGLLAACEPAPWRRTVLLLVAAALVTVSTLEYLRFRRRGLAENALAVNLGAGVVGQAALSLATGGLESPLLPIMLLLAGAAGALIASPRTAAALIGVQIASLWAFAALALFGWLPLNLTVFGEGPALLSRAHLVTAATVMTLFVGASFGIGRSIRRVVGSLLAWTLQAREESLQAYSERTRELMELSGEIAHELKNPLASVKGLASLIARDLPPGKGAERVSVLCREIDRMQAILEEFLNFSRPVAPLNLAAADLSALSQDVLLLHEGMARERGVSLRLEKGPVEVRCDPRKVKQILINLVQNAIEASPANGLVEVKTERGPKGEGVVRVLDSGPGMEESLLDRVFEPGVTTKPKGSGLGLTIARALARQHGGELVLERGERGGCAAVLQLPPAPPAPPANPAPEHSREASP